jgi:Serine-pyruvate aminotransferase/archaeal aspartate aminotransferase
MQSDSDFGTFFLPGPTEVREEVLRAMLKPMIPHRSVEFENLFAKLQVGLGDVFKTRRPVFVSASSGTGMMEAGIRALPEGRILCLVNGAFSERFAHIAEMCGREVDRYEVPWGETHSLEKLDTYLTNAAYRAVTVTHCETSTGALNPVRAVSDLAHSRGALCLIDSVSALGGTELRFDEWGLDYVLTGAQKALALPSGLSFAAASEDMVALASQSKNRGVYFDIVEMDKYAKTNQVPATPAFSLLYALDVQLDAIQKEGVEARWARHTAMASLTSDWLDASRSRTGADWTNIVDRKFRSPTVSTIRLPERITGPDFVKAVKAHGITVGGGYGKLGPTTFRLGHMGDHTVATVQRCIDACEEVIRG